MKRICQLLDFSHVKTKREVFKHARIIATELLFNWKIKSYVGSLHSIEALEFYLVIPNVFEDDSKNGGAAHKRIEQLSSGKFYVHTKSKGDQWSCPIFNRHGIDITCGDTRLKIYGGILLRHLGGKNHKDGSGRALRVVLRGDSGHEKITHESRLFGWSREEVKVLEKLNGADIFDNQTGIVLIHSPRDDIKKLQVMAGKRIGIKETTFADEPLRFYLKSRRAS